MLDFIRDNSYLYYISFHDNMFYNMNNQLSCPRTWRCFIVFEGVFYSKITENSHPAIPICDNKLLHISLESQLELSLSFLMQALVAL